MFDKLSTVESQYQDLTAKLGTSEVQSDPAEYRKAAKTLSDMEPLVQKYREYKGVEQDIAGSEELARGSDPEMRELADEELKTLYGRREALLGEIRILLIPKDPNDEKNVILEIRAGTGGDEAALFAADLFRMYTRHAERQGWKLDVIATPPRPPRSRGSTKKMTRMDDAEIFDLMIKISQLFGTGFEKEPTKVKIVENLANLAFSFDAKLILARPSLTVAVCSPPSRPNMRSAVSVGNSIFGAVTSLTEPSAGSSRPILLLCCRVNHRMPSASNFAECGSFAAGSGIAILSDFSRRLPSSTMRLITGFSTTVMTTLPLLLAMRVASVNSSVAARSLSAWSAAAAVYGCPGRSWM